MERQRNISEFILLGLSYDQNIQILCFVLFLFCYAALLAGKLLILFSIQCSPLFKPVMYHFLSHLSSTDICYTSSFTPKLIADLPWKEKPSPPVTACCRSLPCTSLEALRSSSLLPWPSIAMLPSANLSTA
ncbi:Olfactory receptor 4P4 [Manis javanica]|nr:Olfactory receptor 4P4 [Manis javanica]